ncbi:MAG: DNA/RNA non-specific endonuclease [Bacteroidaceae bacterium]|nr:DNA/RNA non-specific endonuclease [Bacteroidaceae bacterium]
MRRYTKNIIRFLLTAPLAIFLFASCSEGRNGGDDGNEGVPGNRNANIGMHKHAGRIEIPAIGDDELFISHCTTVNGKENITYSMSFNKERKHSKWTAFTFDPSNRGINWKRDNWDNTEWGGDPFQSDPSMPSSYVMTKNEINRNNFVRGHIVASYDRVYSKDANEQTFYYSNISPMYYDFNIGAWNDCEQFVQDFGRNRELCDTLYVVKGGTIREGEYRTVKSDWSDIACPTVPNYYFMALLCLRANGYKALGMLFKHVDGRSKTEICSIDYLEDFTGIDFFCNIPDRVEDIVEKNCKPGQWTGLSSYNYTVIGE